MIDHGWAADTIDILEGAIISHPWEIIGWGVGFVLLLYFNYKFN